MCVQGHRRIWHMFGDRKTPLQGWFAPLIFMWVLGLELKFPDLRGKHLHPLSQPTGLAQSLTLTQERSFGFHQCKGFPFC